MNRHAVQLIARGAINRMGNMLYDYGNSVWLASMGTVGKTVLGIYQISELVTSILVNPFGGVISDRFSRRKILMTTDLVCGLLCLNLSKKVDVKNCHKEFTDQISRKGKKRRKGQAHHEYSYSC